MRLHILGNNSAGNCYLIEENSHYLMLDCGVSFNEVLKAVKFKVNDIVACCVSHFHADHCSSIADINKAFIPIYAGERSDAYPFVRELPTDGDWANVGDGKFLRSFRLDHDESNYGFVVTGFRKGQSLAYISDTGFIKANPKGLQILIVECNFIEALLKTNEEDRYKRIYSSHMSLERLCKWLSKIDRSKLQKIILVHLSDTNSSERIMIETIKELTGIETIAPKNGDIISLEPTPF